MRETLRKWSVRPPCRNMCKQSHRAARPQTAVKSRKCRQENGTATEAGGCKRPDLVDAKVTAEAMAEIANPSMWRHAELAGLEALLEAEQLPC